MTWAWLPGYVSGALVLALAATAVIFGSLRLAGLAQPRRDLPAIGLTLFFLVLTQYPFPDPATLVCPVALAKPRLIPFHTLLELRYPQKTPAGLFFISVAMNFLLCAAIGIALAAQGRLGPRGVIMLALGLPLAVELTQLTGIWGLYPCAYRQFDVDDLTLNFSGIVAGYLCYRLLSRFGPALRSGRFKGS